MVDTGSGFIYNCEEGQELCVIATLFIASKTISTFIHVHCWLAQVGMHCTVLIHFKKQNRIGMLIVKHHEGAVMLP